MDLLQSVWRYIDSTNIQTSSCSPIWQVKHVFLSPAFQTEGSFLEWSGGHIVATQGRYSLPLHGTDGPTPTRCMGPSKQQPPLTSWVSRPKSLQMLFKLTLLIVFLKNGNLPNPRHKYWHQITCNHPRLPPTPYNLSVFYLPFKIEFHQMLWERKQEEQRQVLFGVLQFCCSFPQNVRLHMPCFNFGFNIYFSYRFLF